MQDEKKTFREKWYAELDSNDLRKVWIKGFIVCILAAIVAGFIDYLLMRIQGHFYVGILIIGPFIGVTISNSYQKYHIKYTAIAILYTFIGMILLNLIRLMILFNFSNLGYIFTHGFFIYELFLHPIKTFTDAIKVATIPNYIFAIIEIVLHVLTFVFAYIMSRKNKNKIVEK